MLSLSETERLKVERDEARDEALRLRSGLNELIEEVNKVVQARNRLDLSKVLIDLAGARDEASKALIIQKRK